MSSSQYRAAQSSDSFNPRHADEITLKCLTGEIEEPSKRDADHYKRRLSLIEWCDHMLSPDEQRVSSPREKKRARIGYLSTMRSVWARRLAVERTARAQASRRTEVGRTPSVCRFFSELSRAIEKMIVDEDEPTRQKRLAVLPSTVYTEVRGSPSKSESKSESKSKSKSASKSTSKPTVDTLIVRAETFLTDTEIILSQAQEIIRIDNELEREVVTKLRHTAVHLNCQVTARCEEEGVSIETGRVES